MRCHRGEIDTGPDSTGTLNFALLTDDNHPRCVEGNWTHNIHVFSVRFTEVNNQFMLNLV